MQCGKNRANALASVLSNPNMLSSVYNDALNNSAGSADKELATYMDSIDAHLVGVKESWAQLWQGNVGKEFINPVLDMGAGFLDIVNNVGLLNTALGVTGGMLGGFKNLGRANITVVPYEYAQPEVVVTPNEFMPKMVA